MSTATHTAGAWFVTHDANYGAELAIDTVVDGRTVHIALVHGVGTDDETQANAALIAVAPELAEVLRLALAALEGKPCRQLAIDHARTVLAKLGAK